MVILSLWKTPDAFSRTVGQWWLMRRQFQPGKIGPYKADWVSAKLHQAIIITDDIPLPPDILRQQDMKEAQDRREAYFRTKGWRVAYVPRYIVRHHPGSLRMAIRQWSAEPEFWHTDIVY